MSYNATRYTTMHTQRTGMLAYMGLAERAKARAELAELLSLNEPRPYASYTNAFGAREDLYELPKPVKVIHKKYIGKVFTVSFRYVNM